MRCHPVRWLWGLIPVAMLSWLAVQLQSHAIEQDLERRSTALLRIGGHDWASIVFSGRDGLLVGHPAHARDAEDAVHMVRNVWGVRTVEARVDPPGGLDAPIVPLPERKPPVTLVVASRAAPATVAVSRDAAPLVSAAPAPAALDARPPPKTVQARDHVEGDAVAAPPSPPAPESSAALHDTPIEALGTEAYMAPGPESAATAEQAAPASPVEVPHASDASTPVAEPKAEEAAPTPAVPEAKADAHPTVGQSAVPAPGGAAAVLATEQPPGAVPTEVVPQPPQKEVAAVEQAAPLPEQKVIVEAAAPIPEQKPSVAVPAPPLPARSPRFEAAALPAGNMASETACVPGVREAARGVEVHFARGDAKLDSAGKAVIDKLVGSLEACPEAGLRIAGHADARGQPRRNLALSQRRARTVVRYLAQKGIDEGRLAAVGYGETRPVAPNDTGENRAKNRRIEVVITAPAGSLPPMPVRKQGTRNGLSRR